MQMTKPLEEVTESEPRAESKAWRVATYLSLAVIVGLIILNILSGPKQLKAGDIQSLLVLPFDNFTGDEQLDYVAAGMHTSLIGDIGQISSLRVISKTTARIYNTMGMTLPDMATELNADAVVEPTVMCYGDSVCIQIRVVTPFPEEKQLWIGEYKEDRSKIMNLYNRVTKQIADEVKVQLSSEEEELLTRSRSINKEAYDHYLRGLYYWDLFTPEALQQAMGHFDKAIEADPLWAEPYAGLAYVWVAIHQFSGAPQEVTKPNMFNNLEKAEELDPESSFIRYVGALVKGWTTWEFDLSIADLQYVIQMNPNDAFAHMYLAHGLACTMQKEKAEIHSRIALDLDPMNPMILSLGTAILANAGQYQEAIDMCHKVLTIVPGQPVALSNLTSFYLMLGDPDKAFEFWPQWVDLEEKQWETILGLYKAEGLKPAVELIIRYMEPVLGDQMPLDIAQYYALIGNDSMAMHWYNKAYQERNPMMPYMNTEFGRAEPFRIDDPAFDSLMVKIGLPIQ
jgi:TolB-like protein/Tfp pilus assembly protein PilF